MALKAARRRNGGCGWDLGGRRGRRVGRRRIGALRRVRKAGVIIRRRLQCPQGILAEDDFVMNILQGMRVPGGDRGGLLRGRIAQIYELTNARICQIHALAIAKLRAVLSAA